jgi:hypothetical protein
VTNTATDQNVPAKPMSYGLQAAPVGATIDTNGIIHWTPTVSQVPSTNTFTTVVTNTDPGAINTNALTATNSFIVTINSVHNGPSLPAQTNQTVNELATLTVTNAATDSDVPAYNLTYSLLTPPTGASINSTNGVITWTPAKNQGPSTNLITTVVTDSSPQALSATNSFNVVVNEVNLPPLLPAQTNFSSVATTPIVVTNTATDQNVPAKPMSYGLQAAPVGATIDTNGIIHWTPTVGQVPSTNTFTTVVTNTDPGAVNANALTATNSFVVTIAPIHNGPVLPTQTNQTVNELVTLTVTNAATDGDIPAYNLTYSLLNPPTGATINSTNGVITWTPAKNQGPSTNTIMTVVTDSSPQALSATNSFNVVVNEVNLPPLLPAQTNFSTVATTPIVVTNTAMDQNVPAKPMSYGLQVAPVGATIDTNGIIHWTPTAGQVPSTNTFTTVVTNTDPGAVNANALTATNSFVVTVNAVHNGPALPAQTNQTVNELVTLTVTNAATDNDVPAYALTYSLVNPPTGATINSTNGVITWTPAKNQGPSTNLITTVVTDGSPEALSATNSFNVVVNEVNLPPLLPTQTNFSSVATTPITVTNTATDQNVPAKPMSYGLQVAPVGATIDTNGIIHWTPTVGQVPSTNTFTTVVTNTDPGAVNANALTATNSFVVTITPIHNGPVLPAQTNRSVNELVQLTVTNTATDGDIPGYGLTYSLVNPPTGALINSTNGVITWTPAKNQGPSTNTITTVVTDSSPQALSATNSFNVVVNEVNLPPLLPPQTNFSSVATSPITVTNTATDQNVPAKPMSYGLQAAPVGATIDTNGIIHWTPTVGQVPSTNTFTTVVTNTDPGAVNANALTATNSFVVTVTPIHNGPALPTQTNQTVNELVTLTVTNAATDGDIPAYNLAYSLLSPPTGATINSTNGVITWTPAKNQGPSTNTITTVVTDSSPQALSATNSFNVVVNEVNLPPLLPAQTNFSSVATTPITVTNTATDQNVPAKPMSYGLQLAPVGATIDTNGIIHWTPTVGQVPSTNTFTTVVTNTDPGAVNANALTATNSFVVTVTPIHNGPALPTQTNQTVNELVTLTVTNAATDGDIPAYNLTYSLLSPPTGATINSTNGVITWTPAKNQGPSTNTITTVVTDSSPQALSATNSFNVVVNEVNLPPLLPTQTNFSSVATTPITVTNTATDQNVPAKPMSYGLQVAPIGAMIDTNGIIHWTPTVGQVPSTNTFTTVVTNSDPGAVNANALTATNSFVVTVTPIHNGPVLPAQTNRSVNELVQLTVTNTATDGDIPAFTLTYSLVNPPTGALINSTNGVITWTPAKNQGPSTNTITTVVTDSSPQALSTTNSFNVVVNEVNLPPLLPTQTNFSSVATTPIAVTNTATDQNIPAKPMSYGLQVAPVGATIDTNGIIHWTPTVGQVPSTNTFTTVVTNTDPGAVNANALAATNSFVVTITPIHNGPVLPAQTNRSVNELVQLTVTSTATDGDIPAYNLTYSLLSPPTGATINSTNGVITWTPAKNQGPSTNTITTVVTDSSPQALSATNSFNVVVNEVNLPPLLPIQTNFSSVATTPITVTNTATDQNVPAKPMSYGLQVAPVGATIDANGIIHWTPTVGQVPSTNTFTTVVTNSDPGAVNANALTATNSFVVTITPIHNGPVLTAQSNRTINVSTLLTVTNAASDSDIPAYALNYSLVSPPAGMHIDASGVITWTPTVQQGGTTNLVTTIVTDTAPSPLKATNTFLVIVNSATPPPAPLITSFTITNGVAVVTWSSVAGHTYRLQYRGDFGPGSWSDVVPDVTAAGTSSTATNAVGIATRRFYQVRVVN